MLAQFGQKNKAFSEKAEPSFLINSTAFYLHVQGLGLPRRFQKWGQLCYNKLLFWWGHISVLSFIMMSGYLLRFEICERLKKSVLFCRGLFFISICFLRRVSCIGRACGVIVSANLGEADCDTNAPFAPGPWQLLLALDFWFLGLWGIESLVPPLWLPWDDPRCRNTRDFSALRAPMLKAFRAPWTRTGSCLFMLVCRFSFPDDWGSKKQGIGERYAATN